jgi:hypothetical protein
MGLSLIQPFADFLAQTCGLGIMLTAGLIVSLAFARLLSSSTWWRGWGSPDD